MTTDRPEPDRRDPLPPHPVLTSHYRTEEERVPYIRRLFDESAPFYDRINAWMSLRRGERYRHDALVRADLGPGQRVLDLACGTGVIAKHAIDLVGTAGMVVGLDPSLAMLKKARRRGIALLAAGTAEHLPLADRSVDFVSIGYALRHIADLRLGFAEVLRVLKPGGRVLVLEMVPPRSPLSYNLSKLYLKYLVPRLTSLVTRNPHARRLMEYYWETLDQCVPPQSVLTALVEAGFVAARRSVMYGLFTEYTASRP